MFPKEEFPAKSSKNVQTKWLTCTHSHACLRACRHHTHSFRPLWWAVSCRSTLSGALWTTWCRMSSSSCSQGHSAAPVCQLRAEGAPEDRWQPPVAADSPSNHSSRWHECRTWAVELPVWMCLCALTEQQSAWPVLSADNCSWQILHAVASRLLIRLTSADSK